MWIQSPSRTFRVGSRRARTGWRKSFLPVFVPALLIAIGLFTLAQGVQRFFALPLFEIREVQWEGRVRLRSDRLEASLGPVIGQNIFQIDLKKRVERISAQPGVKEASIRRALPDRIIVKVRERRPAVLLVRRSGAVLVDEEGVVLEPASLSSDLSPDLPRLLGEGAQDPEAIQQGLSLAEFLEREGLSGPRVIEVGRGGDLVLEWEGVRIHWGWGDYPEKWRYFQRAAEDLKRRKESYREADLRFDRQVVIR